MPVKVWDEDEDGLTSRIKTQWDIVVVEEEHRVTADLLDRRLDEILDRAMGAVGRAEDIGHREFVKAHTIGWVLRSERLLDDPSLRLEPREFVWWALAQKCWIGARADGSRDLAWRGLRPPRQRRPVSRDRKKLDYFAMCYWMAEDSREDAVAVFGGSVSNAWQMIDRAALRSIGLRRALRRWLASYDEEERARLTRRPSFRAIMRALRERWPNSGPGSARRPIHYSDDELLAEIAETLREVDAL